MLRVGMRAVRGHVSHDAGLKSCVTLLDHVGQDTEDVIALVPSHAE
jgi:hypothetical protein